MSENRAIVPPLSTSGRSRRRFVKGLAVSGAALGLGLWKQPAWALPNPGNSKLATHSDYHFEIGTSTVNLTGQPAQATTINGSLPGPIVRWREGDTVTMRVTNHLPVSTSIHWHGILLPNAMDGVPGITYAGIAPGETFVYRFQVRQSGTYWYHSHTKFQEQSGLTGPLVIEPRKPEPFKYDRDYVVMLNDWTDEDPETVFTHLKQMSDYYNYQRRTVGTFFSDVAKHGLDATIDNRLAWGNMRMSPRDIADVTGATYTYLVNGQPPAANWTGLFKPGEKVRLRVINGSAMTYFDVRIPGMKMTVVAADGNNVEPVDIDEFRIGVAETYDIIVEPRDNRAYTIFAQALDRSGYARATLAPRPGMAAAAPALDPVPTRTMVDMGMPGMTWAGAEKAGMKNMQNMTGFNGMDGLKGLYSSNDMGAMKDMNSMKGMQHADGMKNMEGMPGMSRAVKNTTRKSGMAGFSPVAKQRNSKIKARETAWPQPQDVHLETGPEVSFIANMPTQRLDKPGDGLNNNGRRVLTYADLKRRLDGPQNAPVYTREHDAEVLLVLTGNMERYIFGFNGQTYAESQPVRFPRGQRIRVTLVNSTMMEHPIHLHGLWSELENGHGRQRPLKHTVSVKPGEKLHYYVTTDDRDAGGRWAYHCHLLYHMEGGMFTSAVVA